jgi:hypothetical protein
MVVWIKIDRDPHAKFRGFSILGRELRVTGYEPVTGEMEDMTGKKMHGRFWVVEASEIYRTMPEMKRFPIRHEAWFIPFEFCESFVRPYYYLDKKEIQSILKS